MYIPHPFRVASDIAQHGYTFVFWDLTANYDMPRRSALWLMWVARQYNRHVLNRNLLDDLL